MNGLAVLQGLADLADILEIHVDESGFAQADNVRRLSNATNRRGIFVAGGSRGILSVDEQLADADHYDGRSVSFFVQLAAVDPERAWRQVWQPVLALHGEYDWLSAREDHERVARLTGGKFEALPGLDHEFLRYDDLLESFRARGTGTFAPAVVDATVAWMETLSATPDS